jgi:hypothetical protein
MFRPEDIERAIDRGVTERQPVPGLRYVGFIVHPSRPGPVTLAIAHREGGLAVQDVIRDGLSVADCAVILRRYGIDRVGGMTDDDPTVNLALACCGAIYRAMR